MLKNFNRNGRAGEEESENLEKKVWLNRGACSRGGGVKQSIGGGKVTGTFLPKVRKNGEKGMVQGGDQCGEKDSIIIGEVSWREGGGVERRKLTSLQHRKLGCEIHF